MQDMYFLSVFLIISSNVKIDRKEQQNTIKARSQFHFKENT